MNFVIFGIILIEFCSARRCEREKRRIKELLRKNGELRIERDQLKHEKGRFWNEYFGEIDELIAQKNELEKDIEKLNTKLEDAIKTTSTSASSFSTTDSTSLTTTSPPITPSDVFILVIPYSADASYLQSGDGSSQISATINAPSNNEYADYAAHAIVNGKLHIFGEQADNKKIARLDDCTFNVLTVRLNEERRSGHAALSIENGKKALICFGYSGDIRKTCEIFDGSTTVSTFSADWTHYRGGLGLYKNQPASVGCHDEHHQKAETLSASGWTALPDHPRRISDHSLVGLENQSMLLIGGADYAAQTGIWQLKDGNWNQIGELLKAEFHGSAIYIGRSIYYFGSVSKAIQRLDFNETEEFQNVEEIGNTRVYLPVLFQTVSNYCI
ncbi:unnamed protein product [Oikopleura dioica]|uniref:Uncharacterized protein n=1 Tax=Oikopleura dioica TaxID=34765 RepID=Q66S90_OIKDI|nr:hypothetical protein 007-06 [Oikopleura dioica]CBY10668.1 unnamed protein product [Oikopleura dioica]